MKLQILRLPQFSKLLFELSKIHQTLPRTKKLHAFIIRNHLSDDPFYATRILRFYAINSDLCSARNLFDGTSYRSVYLWNSVIRAYAGEHQFDDALLLFAKMLRTEIKPDSFTFACVLRACAENFDPDGLRVVHGGVVVSGLGFDSVCGSALVTAYSKLCMVDEASRVFYGMAEPDLVLWNAMAAGYGYCGFWDKGLQLFSAMRSMGEQPDSYTMVGLISGLADPSLLGIGKGIHGFCLKSSFDCNDHVGSALVSMYSRCHCLNSAYGVFTILSQPDLIHGYVLRHGLESEVMISSALIDMYSKCGFVNLGVRVFDSMPNRNTVSYNSMILGLGIHGLAPQAFKMFEEVLEKGFKPDESTFSALLCTCCHAGLVKNGREIFSRMTEEFHIQARTDHYVHMVKLLGMAGELQEAYDLILSLQQPVDSGIWGALLSCCNFHGNPELAEIVAQQLFENKPEKSAYRVMLSNIYAGDDRWDDVKKLRDDIQEAGIKKMPGLSWIGVGRI
ncbi:unnamed protein product, partial [Vitis vinifera]